MSAVYSPLQEAIRYRWSNLTKRQTKEINPALVFATLGTFVHIFHSHRMTSRVLHQALWQFQSLHKQLPNDITHADELEAMANSLLLSADVNKQVLSSVPRSLIEYV